MQLQDRNTHYFNKGVSFVKVNKPMQHQDVSVQYEVSFNEDESELQQIAEQRKRQKEEQRKQMSKLTLESFLGNLTELLFQHYNLAKWDRSIQLTRQFRRSLDTQIVSLLPDDLSTLESALEANKQKLDAIEGDFQEMNSNLEVLNSQNWNLNAKTDHVKAYYRYEEGLKSISLKIEGKINAGLMNVISLFYETEHLPKYTPFMEKVIPVERDNGRLTQRTSEVIINLPIISRRWTVMEGTGVNRIDENKTLFIFMNDAKRLAATLGITKKQKSMVEMNLHKFICQVKCLDYNESVLTMIMNTDLKMKVVPMSFINYICKKFSLTLFKMIEKKATHRFYESIWAQCILGEKNKMFYEMVNTCVKEEYNRDCIEELRKQVKSKA